MKKRGKTILIVFFALGLPIAAILLYLKLNIRAVIKQMVKEQTHGAYQLDFKRLKANYYTLTFTIERGKLTSLDTSNGQSRYFVEFPKVVLQIRSLADILWRKQLHINSIAFEKPVFNIVIQKSSRRTGFFQNTGDIYKYLSSFAEATNINNMQITGAKLLLKDETQNNFTYHLSNINLLIKGFHLTDSTVTEKHRVFLTDAIRLDIGPQTIVIDSLKKISFHGLHLSTTTANLTMDSILYEGKQTDSTEPFKIYLPSLLLKRLNFAKLYNEGVVQVDSVMLNQPRLDLSVNLSPGKGKVKDVKHIMHDVVSHLFGDIDVHFLELKNANTHLITRLLHQERNIDIEKHSLQVNDIYITAGDSGKINLGDFTFSVNEYQSFSPHNKYRMQFNQFSIKNGGDIVLKNLFVYPTSTAKKPLLFLPQLIIDDADIGLLLVEKKIRARKFVLESAVIKHELEGLKEGESAKSIGAILKGITLNADISELEFNNGSYTVIRGGSKPLQFSADSLHLYFKFKDHRLQLQSSTQLLDALQNISAKHLQFSNASYNLQAGSMQYGEDNVLRLTGFNFSRGADRNIHGKSLIISKPDIPVILDDNKFVAQAVQINDANIIHEGYNQNRAGVRQGLDVDIKNVKLNNIHLSSFERGDIKISGNNISAELKDVHKEKKGPITFSIKDAHTKDIEFSDSYISAKASKISVTLGSLSSITNFALQRKQPGDTLLVNSPVLYFQPSRFDIATKQIELDHLFADSMKVYAAFYGKQAVSKNQLKVKWQLSLQTSRLLKADVDVRKDNMHFVSPVTDVSLETFISTEQNIKALVNCKNYQYHIDQDTMQINVSGNALKTTFNFEKQDDENMLNIRTIKTSGADIYMQQKKHYPIIIKNINLNGHNLQWLTSEKPSLVDWASLNHLSSFSAQYVELPTELNHFTINNIRYEAGEEKLYIDSFSFIPPLNANDYFEKIGYQTDYISGWFNGVEIYKPDLGVEKRNINANSISINGFLINAYRDKTYSPKNIYKALPASLMRKSSLTAGIDTIYFNNGKIVYTEVSEKTEKAGAVVFNNVNGYANTFKLKDIQRNDTFHVNASAMLMDKGKISLQYATPLSSLNDQFTADVQIDTFNLKHLNPLLEPLVLANVHSGKIDSLTCHISGDNFSGKGTMHFLYHDLVITLLSGNPNHKKNVSFFSRLKSFAANTFVLKKNNTGRTGNVYYERIKSKFIFNYLVKLTISGVMTSTGAKSNKSLQKQEKKSKQKKMMEEKQGFLGLK